MTESAAGHWKSNVDRIVHHAEGLSAGKKGISDYYLPRNHLWLARAHHPAFAISALAFLTPACSRPRSCAANGGALPRPFEGCGMA